MAKAALASTRPLVAPHARGSLRWGRDGLVSIRDNLASPQTALERWQIRSACVADNDNVNPDRRDERLILGIVLFCPVIASLGMVALMFGLSA